MIFDNLIIKCCYGCGNILAYYYLDWIGIDVMIERWSWCHTFGVMYDLYLFEYIKYNIPILTDILKLH